MNLKHHSSGKKKQSGETGILDDKELLKKGG